MAATEGYSQIWPVLSHQHKAMSFLWHFRAPPNCCCKTIWWWALKLTAGRRPLRFWKSIHTLSVQTSKKCSPLNLFCLFWIQLHKMLSVWFVLHSWVFPVKQNFKWGPWRSCPVCMRPYPPSFQAMLKGKIPVLSLGSGSPLGSELDWARGWAPWNRRFSFAAENKTLKPLFKVSSGGLFSYPRKTPFTSFFYAESKKANSASQKNKEYLTRVSSVLC